MYQNIIRDKYISKYRNRKKQCLIKKNQYQEKHWHLSSTSNILTKIYNQV